MAMVAKKLVLPTRPGLEDDKMSQHPDESTFVSKLESVALLQDMDDTTRRLIMQSLQVRRYYPGDVVFYKGTEGTSLFFVQQGTFDVIVGENNADPADPMSYRVDQIQSGSVFGEIALLLSMPRTATICAHTEAVVHELQRSDFEAVAARSIVLNKRLQAIKEERFVRFRKDLEAACFNPDNLEPKQRAYLMEVFKQIDTDGSGAIDVAELAVMLTRLAGRFFSDEQVTAMMDMLDQDGNGSIEAPEFLAGLPLLAKWLVASMPAASADPFTPTTELDLEQVELLQGMDAASRLKIIVALKRRHFNKGDIAFNKGSTGQSLFFLQQGVMDVVVGDGNADPAHPNSMVVDQIPSGSVFGEMALLLSMPRTATIRTASDTAVAYELERTAFEQAAAQSPILNRRLQAIKEERFARFRKDLDTAVLRPEEMDDKQRAHLLEVFKQIDEDGSGAIDQDEFAAMLGRLSGRTFSDDELAGMLKAFDKDGNDTIEAEEFLAGLPLLAKWLTNEEREKQKTASRLDEMYFV
mmetsp:Transcript_5871/g.11771  ORF Transcript_5871/g.11771 Transcript_5871/m.11771 type:complete len:524 (+) Transcript_5871:144-1715(+)